MLFLEKSLPKSLSGRDSFLAKLLCFFCLCFRFCFRLWSRLRCGRLYRYNAVTALYCVCRTAFCALSAACAFAVINVCIVVFNGDSAEFTDLFALLTADTAVFAGCTGVFADILRGTENVNAVRYIVHNDKLIRTGLCAESAAAAL